MPLVLDHRLAHERWGSSADPNINGNLHYPNDKDINGNLHYPNDKDRSLHEAVTDKIRKYRSDYNNRSPYAISLMTAIASTAGREVT